MTKSAIAYLMGIVVGIVATIAVIWATLPDDDD